MNNFQQSTKNYNIEYNNKIRKNNFLMILWGLSKQIKKIIQSNKNK